MVWEIDRTDEHFLGSGDILAGVPHRKLWRLRQKGGRISRTFSHYRGVSGVEPTGWSLLLAQLREVRLPRYTDSPAELLLHCFSFDWKASGVSGGQRDAE